MYTVYSISCPISKEIKYIGITCQILGARLQAHVLGNGSPEYQREWFRNIIALGELPIIEEIETFINKPSAILAEKFWIEQFRQWGFSLLNGANNLNRKSKIYISKS